MEYAIQVAKGNVMAPANGGALVVEAIVKEPAKLLALANALLPININKNGKGYKRSKQYTPCCFPEMKI